MSTRALVARQNANGSVQYTSINFDGYLSHVGMLLLQAWITDAALDALFAEGKVSSLGRVMGVRHDGSKFPPEPGTDDYTIFYHRDRNQSREETQSLTAESFDAMLATKDAEGVPYVYLKRDDQWLVRRKDSNGVKELMPLTTALDEVFTKVEIFSNDENGWVLNVDIEEEERSWDSEKQPKLGEIVEFLNNNAEGKWRWQTNKADDNRILVESDSAVVALKLRFNINDHKERLEATA
jgi:hypothetical protein